MYKTPPYLFKMRAQVLLSVAPKFIYICTEVLKKRNTSVAFFVFYRCPSVVAGYVKDFLTRVLVFIKEIVAFEKVSYTPHPPTPPAHLPNF